MKMLKKSVLILLLIVLSVGVTRAQQPKDQGILSDELIEEIQKDLHTEMADTPAVDDMIYVINIDGELIAQASADTKDAAFRQLIKLSDFVMESPGGIIYVHRKEDPTPSLVSR